MDTLAETHQEKEAAQLYFDKALEELGKVHESRFEEGVVLLRAEHQDELTAQSHLLQEELARQGVNFEAQQGINLRARDREHAQILCNVQTLARQPHNRILDVLCTPPRTYRKD